MKIQNIDQDWQFYLGDYSMLSMGATATWTKVDLPHDWDIYYPRNPKGRSDAQGAYNHGGDGNYIKKIFIPKEFKGKRVVLQVGGAYQNTQLSINSNILSDHFYGYSTYNVDITDKLRYGEDNTILLKLHNDGLPNARWYSGSGLYRHVNLLIGEKAHIAPWGIFVTTPKAEEEASIVEVETKLVLLENSKVTLKSSIIDGKGNIIGESEKEPLLSKGENKILQTFEVKPAILWDLDNPYLYQMVSEVIVDGIVIDTVKTSFGIRKIEIDATNGFRLNGVPIKLKGGCVHHDNGPLGAASYDRAEERKVEIHKANGFNAIRCAHNTPAEAMLDACDRLGILVIDEAFDYWNESKKAYDNGMTFKYRWKDDMDSMILRDRNHPSIIIWSYGNEIIEKGGRSEGYEWSRRIAGYARELDATRYINMAVDDIYDTAYYLENIEDIKLKDEIIKDPWGALTKEFVKPLDVVGYNYLLHRYEEDGIRFPKRVICGTESFPEEASDNWELVKKLPYVIGDFVWTSLDYIGESGIGRAIYEKDQESIEAKFPWHLATCGDIDICGRKRPQSYYRDIVWGSVKPFIAVYKPENYGRPFNITKWGWKDVAHNWTYPGYEGKLIEVDIYANCTEAILYLNGKIIGKKPCTLKEKYKCHFELIYEAGILEVICYDKGLEIGKDTLKTTGDTKELKVTSDREKLKAQFRDLAYVNIELIDSEGNYVTHKDMDIEVKVEGEGVLLAMGSANTRSEELYTQANRKTFQGKLLAIIGTTGETGEIKVTAKAKGIKAFTLKLPVE